VTGKIILFISFLALWAISAMAQSPLKTIDGFAMLDSHSAVVWGEEPPSRYRTSNQLWYVHFGKAPRWARITPPHGFFAGENKVDVEAGQLRLFWVETAVDEQGNCDGDPCRYTVYQALMPIPFTPSAKGDLPWQIITSAFDIHLSYFSPGDSSVDDIEMLDSTHGWMSLSGDSRMISGKHPGDPLDRTWAETLASTQDGKHWQQLSTFRESTVEGDEGVGLWRSAAAPVWKAKNGNLTEYSIDGGRSWISASSAYTTQLFPWCKGCSGGDSWSVPASTGECLDIAMSSKSQPALAGVGRACLASDATAWVPQQRQLPLPPTTHNLIYVDSTFALAMSYSEKHSRFYQTTDEGASWHPAISLEATIPEPHHYEYFLAQASGNSVLALLVRRNTVKKLLPTTFKYLLYSPDHGKTWKPLNSPR